MVSKLQWGSVGTRSQRVEEQFCDFVTGVQLRSYLKFVLVRALQKNRENRKKNTHRETHTHMEVD